MHDRKIPALPGFLCVLGNQIAFRLFIGITYAEHTGRKAYEAGFHSTKKCQDDAQRR
jgi:hypothetical protein